MTLTEIWQIVLAIIASFGGAGVIIIVLSSWLGKVWANRLMESDRAKHQQELESFRSQLQHKNETDINNIKHELDIFREKYLKSHRDKIQIYRFVIDIVSNLLGDFDLNIISKLPEAERIKRIDNYNRQRIQAYGYLGMLAPQPVMNAFNNLFDHLRVIVKCGVCQHDQAALL